MKEKIVMNKFELSLEIFLPDSYFEKQSITSEELSDMKKHTDIERSSNSEKYLNLDLPPTSEFEVNLFNDFNLKQIDLLNNLLLEISKLILCREKNVQQILLQQKLSAKIEVELVTAQVMQQINASIRGIDEITDVLSFPAFSFGLIHKSHKANKCEIKDFDFTIERYAWLDPTAEYGTISLGEIIICPLKAQEQAVKLGHSLIREVCFLFMHGLLHLCGYDHKTGEETGRMFALQKDILPELENSINNHFKFEEQNVEK